MKYRKYLQNTAIFLLMLVALKNILAVAPFAFVRRVETLYRTFIHPEQAVLHMQLSFLLGVMMLLLVYRLYKRVRMAWFVEVVLLTVTIVLQALRYHRFTVPIILIECFILLCLLVSYRDFGREPNRLTVKKSLGFIAASLVLLCTNAVLSMFSMKGDLHFIENFEDALEGAFRLFVLLDTSVLSSATRGELFFVKILTALNWVFIFSALALLLKPLVYDPAVTRRERRRVQELALEFGQNSMAYLAMERDKRYLFGQTVAGVCAYTVVSDVLIVCGDMLCAPEDGRAFLAEILCHCRRNAYRLLFVGVTEQFLPTYQAAGCGTVKVGEECCMELDNFSLAGGKRAKLRAAVNHVAKAGIAICEYRPNEKRRPEWERQMQEITNLWLKNKGGYELCFVVGGLALDEPLDRRYFCATDAGGRLLGFVVFLPFSGGWLADVTRRRDDAENGVIEAIICAAAAQFAGEGSHLLSMGLATLYNVTERDRATFTEKLFTYIYENLDGSFGFQNLHKSKEKYAPDWRPRYLAYTPKPFSPRFAYALVRCQVKTGFSKLLRGELGHSRKLPK